MMGAVSRLIKHPKTQRGFTIVEVMIVLAITGVLFVAITATLQGKRQKTEFNQAINAVKTEIEQYINEAQSGHYPSDASFTANCSGLASAPAPYATGSISAPEQGANNGCIYLGRLLQFSNTAFGDNPQSYKTYTLMGVNGKASFVDSNPQIVDIDSTMVKKPLQFGLTLESMTANGNPVGAVAFVPSIGEKGSSNLIYGSQADSDVVAIETSISDSGVEGTINNKLSSGILNPDGGVKICFKDGYNQNQSALITIGGSSGTSTVSLSIKGTGNCT